VPDETGGLLEEEQHEEVGNRRGDAVDGRGPRGCWGSQGQTQAMKGHLVDVMCTSHHATEAGYAEKHDKKCLLMDECVKSGYSLVTGVKASCRIIGHQGAIATADGRIWNIVEQQTSTKLIHDESLLGKSVVVRGRLFRNSRALVIDSYQLGS